MPDGGDAVVPVLIGGRWEEARATRWADVFNPSQGVRIARTPLCGADDVNRAVTAAAGAFPAWAETPAVERARVMFRLRELLVREQEALAALVSREHGKTRSEARAGVQRGIEVVEFACGLPSLLAGDHVQNLAPGIDCTAVRRPLGVCVGITPFNFPVMVPLWMLPVALTCGNTFVLKPSEKTPLSAIRLAELFHEAGLPDGVLNVVHGDQECVTALVTHPQVQAVSFVGSTRVAQAVHELGTRLGKRVQAGGGAKNHLLVLPDADLEVALSGVLASAFGCAGERCMAGSVVAPIGNGADEFVERLCERVGALTVGPTDTGDEPDMGPVISSEARDRVVRYLAAAETEGARVCADGRRRQFDTDGFLLGPSVVDAVEPTMRVAREEVFGPLLAVLRAPDLETALSRGGDSGFGNGAVLFTRSAAAAREFARRFPAGMLGINVGVPAPMAWFPFTGWNRSFFGDLHMQGVEGMQFYTRQQVIMARW